LGKAESARSRGGLADDGKNAVSETGCGGPNLKYLTIAVSDEV
jgi:hypothetical protein